MVLDDGLRHPHRPSRSFTRYRQAPPAGPLGESTPHPAFSPRLVEPHKGFPCRGGRPPLAHGRLQGHLGAGPAYPGTPAQADTHASKEREGAERPGGRQVPKRPLASPFSQLCVPTGTGEAKGEAVGAVHPLGEGQERGAPCPAERSNTDKGEPQLGVVDRQEAGT